MAIYAGSIVSAPYTATGTNIFPSYQWFLNGALVASTPTYRVPLDAVGKTVSVEVTLINQCGDTTISTASDTVSSHSFVIPTGVNFVSDSFTYSAPVSSLVERYPEVGSTWTQVYDIDTNYTHRTNNRVKISNNAAQLSELSRVASTRVWNECEAPATDYVVACDVVITRVDTDANSEVALYARTLPYNARKQGGAKANAIQGKITLDPSGNCKAYITTLDEGEPALVVNETLVTLDVSPGTHTMWMEVYGIEPTQVFLFWDNTYVATRNLMSTELIPVPTAPGKAGFAISDSMLGNGIKVDNFRAFSGVNPPLTYVRTTLNNAAGSLYSANVGGTSDSSYGTWLPGWLVPSGSLAKALNFDGNSKVWVPDTTDNSGVTYADAVTSQVIPSTNYYVETTFTSQQFDGGMSGIALYARAQNVDSTGIKDTHFIDAGVYPGGGSTGVTGSWFAGTFGADVNEKVSNGVLAPFSGTHTVRLEVFGQTGQFLLNGELLHTFTIASSNTTGGHVGLMIIRNFLNGQAAPPIYVHDFRVGGLLALSGQQALMSTPVAVTSTPIPPGGSGFPNCIFYDTFNAAGSLRDHIPDIGQYWATFINTGTDATDWVVSRGGLYLHPSVVNSYATAVTNQFTQFSEYAVELDFTIQDNTTAFDLEIVLKDGGPAGAFTVYLGNTPSDPSSEFYMEFSAYGQDKWYDDFRNTKFNADTTYTVRFEVYTDHFSGYLNGTLIQTITYDTPPLRLFRPFLQIDGGVYDQLSQPYSIDRIQVWGSTSVSPESAFTCDLTSLSSQVVVEDTFTGSAIRIDSHTPDHGAPWVDDGGLPLPTIDGSGNLSRASDYPGGWMLNTATLTGVAAKLTAHITFNLLDPVVQFNNPARIEFDMVGAGTYNLNIQANIDGTYVYGYNAVQVSVSGQPLSVIKGHQYLVEFEMTPCYARLMFDGIVVSETIARPSTTASMTSMVGNQLHVLLRDHSTTVVVSDIKLEQFAVSPYATPYWTP